MKRNFLILIALSMTLILCACSSASEPIATAEVELTTEPTAATEEVTEPTLATEPEWFSEEIIDEALSYIFVTEGEKDIPLAQELLLPLVEAGDPEAQYYWGYIYDCELECNDEGAEEEESLYWCRLAANQGFPKAYISAALNLFTEPEEKLEMIKQAEEAGLFEISPEELGADGCYYIGAYYDEKNDYEKAVYWYSYAANMGCTKAMDQLGFLYIDGSGVQQNYLTAYELISKGAALEYTLSIHNKGWCYENGYGVQQSYSDAMNDYLKAADRGYASSMNNIAYLYNNGLGVEQDFAAAREWYEKSAEFGNGASMINLGSLYYNGSGVSKDYDEAMKWFLKAYANGDTDIEDSIQYLLKKKYGVNGFFENYGDLISAP